MWPRRYCPVSGDIRDQVVHVPVNAIVAPVDVVSPALHTLGTEGPLNVHADQEILQGFRVTRAVGRPDRVEGGVVRRRPRLADGTLLRRRGAILVEIIAEDGVKWCSWSTGQRPLADYVRRSAALRHKHPKTERRFSLTRLLQPGQDQPGTSTILRRTVRRGRRD